MIQRIKDLILKEDLTSGSFADAIGVQRSSMSHILNGRNNPSLDFIIKTLQRFKGLNATWLLTGEGPMYSDQKNMNSQLITEPSIFSSIPENSTVKPSAEEVKVADIQHPEKKENQKFVDKVLIFYSDHTYDEFLKPEKDVN